MKYTLDGLHLTEQFEGCRLVAYQDSVGVWTIGYGHTLGVHQGMTCTQAEAEAWLQSDIQACVDGINKAGADRLALTQGEFNALVDFSFNLGLGALMHSTLWKLVLKTDFEAAAKEFPKWDMAGGKHLAGLLRRRVAEQAMFLRP